MPFASLPPVSTVTFLKTMRQGNGECFTYRCFGSKLKDSNLELRFNIYIFDLYQDLNLCPIFIINKQYIIRNMHGQYCCFFGSLFFFFNVLFIVCTQVIVPLITTSIPTLF